LDRAHFPFPEDRNGTLRLRPKAVSTLIIPPGRVEPCTRSSRLWKNPGVKASWLLLLLAVAPLRGCVAYEFEEEFWLQVDGSGSVNVTATPELWHAFKGVTLGEDPRQSVRRLFEASGLSVRRVTITSREGRPYLFVAADFRDVNALPGTPAFPDLKLSYREVGQGLELDGTWTPKPPEATHGSPRRDGLLAVRFHLPSKIYSHRNAYAGVERGNIVGWREDVSSGLEGRPLSFGALLDRRSILWSTVSLFFAAIGAAGLILGGTVYLVARKGRPVPHNPALKDVTR
jgi:hypothetical protein